MPAYNIQPCTRCGGKGTYLHFGTCFKCGGSGTQRERAIKSKNEPKCEQQLARIAEAKAKVERHETKMRKILKELIALDRVRDTRIKSVELQNMFAFICLYQDCQASLKLEPIDMPKYRGILTAESIDELDASLVDDMRQKYQDHGVKIAEHIDFKRKYNNWN